MSACPSITDLAWRLLEGELDEVAEEELVRHLEGCPVCREELRQTVRIHRLLIAQALSGGLRPGVNRTPPPLTGRRTRMLQPAAPWSRPRWRWVGGLLAAAALVVALLWGLDERVAATLPAIADTPPAQAPAPVFARLLGAEGVQVNGYAVNQGTTLIPGSLIAVSSTGSARIELADGTVIAASATTRCELKLHARRSDGGTAGLMVELAQGSLAAQVSPQDPLSPLVFRTPLAEAVVMGTELMVEHRPGNGSELSVTSGKVLWMPQGGGSLLVGQGQHARVGAEVASSAILRLDSLAGLERQERYLCAWKDARGHGHTAHPVVKDCRPRIITRQGRQTVDFCNHRDRLLVPIGSCIDLRKGLTLLVVLEPQGADTGERIAVLYADGAERLGLVRSGLPAALQLELDGRSSELSQPLGQGIWTLACRLQADGGVELLRGTRRLVSGHMAVQGLAGAELYLGGDRREASLSGLMYALELYNRPLSDAELEERFTAIARLHAFSE